MIEVLREHGLQLLAGSSVLLALGCLAMRFSRSPLHAQRRGELCLLAVLLFVPAALLPLPRHGRDLLQSLSDLVTPVATNTLRETPTQPSLRMPPSSEHLGALDANTLLGAQLGARLAETSLERASPQRDPTSASANSANQFAAQTPAEPAPLIEWMFVLGAAASLAWLTLGVLRLAKLLAATSPAPAWLNEWIHEQAPELRIAVRIGPGSRSPFCVGLLRQTIVLPPALLHGGRRGLHSVLLHELAHARHGDGRGRLLVALALPLLWFHPLYWWLRKRVQLNAELLADDHAAADNRPAYARELLNLVQRLPAGSPLPAGARPVFGAPHEFTRRIEMLLQRRDRLNTRCSVADRGAHSLFLVGLVLLSGTFFGATPVAAQSASADESHATIDRLHAERAELKTELGKMHAELEDMRAALKTMQAHTMGQAKTKLALHASDLEHKRATEVVHAQELASHAQSSLRIAELATVLQAQAKQSMEAGNAALAGAQYAKLLALHASESGQRASTGRQHAEQIATLLAGQNEALNQAHVAKLYAEATAQQSKRTPQLVDPYATLHDSTTRIVTPRAPVDLQAMLDLASKAIGLRSELELAGKRAAETAQLVEQKLVSEAQLHREQLNVDALSQRLKFLHQGLQNETQSLANALERARLMLELAANKIDEENGKLHVLEAEHRVQQLQANLNLMQAIR